MYSSTDMMSMDVETSSAAPLQSVGAAAYLAHPSTVCLMMSYHPVGDPAPPRLWKRGQPPPEEVVEHVRRRGLWSGWNVLHFDRVAWKLLLETLGFPPIDDDCWRDSMHLAAGANLPRSLDGCAKAVGMGYVADLKDNNVIRRITDQNRTPITVHADGSVRFGDRNDQSLKPAQLQSYDDDMAWLEDRCVQDSAMEEGIMLRLPPWPDMRPWVAMPYVDRRINDRGVRIDLPLVRGLAAAAATETARLDREMDRLTDGRVPKCTNIEGLKRFLLDSGVDLPRKNQKREGDEEVLDGISDDEDAKETVAEKGSPYRLRKNDMANLLADALPGDDTEEQPCRSAIVMRMEAAKASARKLVRMSAMADERDRIGGLLTLMGAQATGRFASGVVQWHNFVRDAFAKDYETIAEKNGLHPKRDKDAVKAVAAGMLRTAIEVGRTGDANLIRMMYEAPRKDLQGREHIEGVLPWISRMMRRTITTDAGKLLINGDFSNIQARVPVWLAGQQETVDAFARGEDLYRIQAAPIYGLPPEQLSAEQRQIGKVMRLFLGFAAGVNAFIPACMIYGIVIPRGDAKRYVDIFRTTNAALAAFWDANLQAAIWAVQYPGREFFVPPTGYVSWFTYGDCLCLRLPSGRLLRYWEPRLSQGYWDSGAPKPTLDLTVLVVKGRARFRRTLWRGLAMQNLVCAVEADLLCGALLNVEEAGIDVMLHVHDSIAAEVPEDKANTFASVFKDCMLRQPDYYAGLPIAADVDVSARFG